MNLNVIDGTTVRPQIGGLFDWLKTAAGSVDSVIQTVQPVIQDAKSTFGSGSTGIVSPTTQTQLNPQQSISTWEGQQQQQPQSNNTMLYVGLGAAALIVILLLNKK